MVGGKVLPGHKKETQLVSETYEDGELVERIEEIGVVGITHKHEMHQVLAESGFAVREEWGDYDFTPYQEGDSLLIVEAVREN